MIACGPGKALAFRLVFIVFSHGPWSNRLAGTTPRRAFYSKRDSARELAVQMRELSARLRSGAQESISGRLLMIPLTATRPSHGRWAL
jgi:hypothetical protein